MLRIFRHYVPASLLALGIAESSILFGSMYVGVVIRFWQHSLEDLPAVSGGVSPVFPIFPKALVFTITILAIMIAMGLYQRDHDRQSTHYARLGASFVFGLLAMVLIFYAAPTLFLGRGPFALTVLIAFVGIAIVRFAYYTLTGHGGMKRRVLVLGTGTRAAKVDALEKSSHGRQGFQVVGYLPLKGGHHFVDKSKVLADQGSICCIASKYDIDEVVVGVRDRRGGGLPIDDVLACKLDGIHVVDLPTFFERETGHVELQSLNPSWLIFSDGFSQGTIKDTGKRLFDVCVSVVLLAMTWPIILLTALLVRLESRGPIFYRQIRVGEGGKHFDILKFRSMRADAEKDGTPQWAATNDARVTRVGRVIRKLRIDELPQVFNVLKGEMSFVGPRPERPFFVEQLSRQIPYYTCRHNVKPGITGWAQIRYAYGATVEDAIEKLQYDLYYVKNHSLFLDLIILFQTAQVILFGKGAR